MKSLFEQVSRLWKQFNPVQRVTIGVAAAGVLVGMIALLMWAERPEMKLLYGKLGEKEAAEVVASLEAQGVKYQIGAGGTSIYVPSDRVHRVRMDLAAKGIPGGEGVGFEIFDRSNFGISDFVQHTNFTRALQGELARTISQLNGVRSARVMVVMPESRLLLKSADTRPTASVFVDVGGSTLGVEAVNSIRSLVANAVEGLRVDDVAVVDSRGNVLSEELKSDPLLGTASSQIKFRKSVEDYLSGKVETMLAKVLGPGKAVVRVSAEIDTAAVSTVDEKYDPESQVARSETTTDDSTLTTERKEASSGNNAVGASANTPTPNDPTISASPTKNTEDSRKSKTQMYEINKVVTNTTKNPGAIKQLTAAVFVAQRPKGAKEAAPAARTPAELDSLRQMVVNALGVQSANAADLAKLVSIQEVAFEAPVVDTSVSPERIMNYVDTAKPLLTILLTAGIFFFFVRMLRREKSQEGHFELIATGTGDKPLLDETTVPDANKGHLPVSPEMLNELIRQKPDNVAAALRGWLTQTEKKAS